jgi:hypothetical protein
MPGRRHELLVATLREHPSVLRALVRALTGCSLPAGLEPVDSTARFVDTAEVRPDLILARDDKWTIVEVQDRPDPEKRRRWPLAASLLLDQRGTLGDVIVITSRHSVAEWAGTVAHLSTPLGTRLELTPVVLHLSRETTERLLTVTQPELALVAVWSVSHRHGRFARQVVEQAIEVTNRLPAALQEAQGNAILGLLGERMLAWLKETMMDPDKIPMSPAARKLKALISAEGRKEGRKEGLAEGLARGKREVLLDLLDSRGLPVTAAQRATIDGCVDPVTLGRWVVKAATAASVGEVLAIEPQRRKVPASKGAVPRTKRATGL